MFSGLKIALVFIILAAAGGGLFYVKQLQSNLEISRLNNAKLETAVETTEKSLALLKEDNIRLNNLSDQLTKDLQKAEQYGDSLRNRLRELDLVHDAITESKDLEDKNEVMVLNEQLENAASALEEFIQTLDSAQTDLETSKSSLEEAKSEELAVQEIMESSGDESAKFSQQLTKLLGELGLANETLNAAQTEVNRTAAQAEIISEQLSNAQQESEENRLLLGELELQGEEFTGPNSTVDRNKLSTDLITAQRSEGKLVEESQLIENKLRESERKRERLRAEMETSSGAKGMAGGAAAIIAARDNGELTGIIGSIAELCAPVDSSHDSALATAIGGGMTSIIVESDEVAARAIKWLAERLSLIHI